MKSKVISIRLNEDELKYLEGVTTDVGVKVTDYIRATMKMVMDYRYFKEVQAQKDRSYGE